MNGGEPAGDEQADRRAGLAQAWAHQVKAAELVGGFEGAGVPAVLIKGELTAAHLYEAREPRPSSDVDVLIPVSSLARAEALCASLGFEPVFVQSEDITLRGLHAGTWRRPRDETWLDLHTSLPEAACSPECLWDALVPHHEPLLVAGKRLTGLDATAVALLVALHAAQRGPTAAGPLEDLRRAIAKWPIELWEGARDLSRLIESEGAFAEGLLQSPEGEPLVAKLGLSRHASAERLLAWEAAPSGAIVLEQVLMLRGTRARFAYLLRLLFPTPAHMRTGRRLARHGRSGLTLSYLLRPLELVVRLPRAGIAVARARRAARRAS